MLTLGAVTNNGGRSAAAPCCCELSAALLALLGGHPLISAAVEGIAGRVIERLFGRVHDQVALAVLLCQLERVEGNRDVFLPAPRKPPTPTITAFILPSLSTSRSLTSPILLSWLS
jgi:hypothetical protein